MNIGPFNTNNLGKNICSYILKEKLSPVLDGMQCPTLCEKQRQIIQNFKTFNQKTFKMSLKTSLFVLKKHLNLKF